MSAPDFLNLARSLSRDEFIRKVPKRFLVLDVAADGLRPITSFATQVLRNPVKETGAGEPTVLPLVKSQNNPYTDRLSVGRARNCDLVIRDPSISKLHAIFRGEADLTVSDVDSQNGTFLNGKRLLPNEVVPISFRDEIMFGSVLTRLMNAAAVYDLLRAFEPRRT